MLTQSETYSAHQLSLFVSHLDYTAELSSPHYPQLAGQPWFPYTKAQLMIELRLTPCASLLYHWALTKGPAGTLIEVDLKDFQALTAEYHSQGNGKGYSMRHIRRAIGELEELQLVDIQSERVRMLTRHPGPVVNRKPKAKTVSSQTPGHKCPTPDINVQPRTFMSGQKAKPTVSRAFEPSTDLYRSNRSTTTTEPVAAASEILEKDPWSEQLTEKTEGEDQGQEEINSEGAKVPSKDKPSAVQLEILKKLGLTLSYAFKERLEAVGYQTVEKAITCFKEDKLTWTGGEMNNPTGCFIKALREVEAGRQPEQHLELLETDPILATLEMWRGRWFNCLPSQRPNILRDIRAELPGEIDVLDDDEGPVLV